MSLTEHTEDTKVGAGQVRDDPDSDSDPDPDFEPDRETLRGETAPRYRY